MVNNSESLPLTVGSYGDYEWLATEHCLDDLLRLCPEIVLGKYISVTSIDSGRLFLTDEDIAAGWESRGGIGYSPKVSKVETLPREGWDEWYVFEEPTDLGQLEAQGSNVFEVALTKGEVYTFVNYNFGLHRADMETLTPYFWKQFNWIRPQTYIAESDSHLTIVSADKSIFAAARIALSRLDL
jgi:hypothetical protein